MVGQNTPDTASSRCRFLEVACKFVVTGHELKQRGLGTTKDSPGPAPSTCLVACLLSLTFFTGKIWLSAWRKDSKTVDPGACEVFNLMLKAMIITWAWDYENSTCYTGISVTFHWLTLSSFPVTQNIPFVFRLLLVSLVSSFQVETISDLLWGCSPRPFGGHVQAIWFPAPHLGLFVFWYRYSLEIFSSQNMPHI